MSSLTPLYPCITSSLQPPKPATFICVASVISENILPQKPQLNLSLLYYPALTTATLSSLASLTLPSTLSSESNSPRAQKKKSDHITPLLKSLHWLPVHLRIHYKILSLCYKSLNNSAPCYLSNALHLYIPSRSLRSVFDPLRLQTPKPKLRVLTILKISDHVLAKEYLLLCSLINIT